MNLFKRRESGRIHVYLLVQIQNISRRIQKRMETLEWGRETLWLGERCGSETFHCLPFCIFIILYLMQPIQKLFLFFKKVFFQSFLWPSSLPAIILILYRTTQRVCLYLLSLFFHLYSLSNPFKPRFYSHHSTSCCVQVIITSISTFILASQHCSTLLITPCF